MQSLLALVKRRRVALGVVVGLIALYTLGGFLLVPYVARNEIVKRVPQALGGRQITIGKLTFNPFTCTVQVGDLQLDDTDGKPLLGFRSLLVNAEPVASLFTRSIYLKELRLVAPDVDVVIEPDGSVNLTKLAPPSNEPEPQAPAELPRIRITQLAVEEGRVGFEDRSRPAPFSTQLRPIHFALSHFRTEPNYENAYGFAATSEAGEQFDWKGRFTVQPLGSDGEFSVKSLQVGTIDAYLQDQLPVQLRSGLIDLAGRYQLALQPALDLSIDVPSFSLRDFSAAARGAAGPPPVTVLRLALDGLGFSLGKRSVTLQSASIEGADIDVVRAADGSINLLQMLSASQPAAVAATGAAKPVAAGDAPTPAAAPWQIAVAHAAIKDAAVHAEDRSVRPAAKFELTPIQLSADGYSSDPAAQVKLDADVTINGSGRLQAQGMVAPQPLAAQVALQLSGIGLPAVQPYIAQATNATLHSGVLGAQADISYAAEPAKGKPQLRFRGDVKVDNLRASGNGEDAGPDSDFARWKRLAITGLDYAMAPDRLSIERIALTQPYGRVIINPDRTLNVAQILKGTAAPPAPEDPASKDGKPKNSTKPASAPSAAPAAAPMMPVAIRQIRIDDGSAFFADRSLQPSFAAGIVKLRGGVENLSSDPASRAKIQLDGEVDQFSPVSISGTSSLLAATRWTDMKLSFRNMELTTFNPYSGKFAGYNISKGKLTTELSYKIDQRQLEAEHHVVIDQLEFGAATDSKDAVPLPIKLAVALLKDRNGVIDLSLPVRGSLDDPEFKYGGLIWQVLRNVLTKIVTAPFALLGSLFGGGADLSYVDFAPGSVALTPDASGKLDNLGKALIERPQLKLDVPVSVMDADRVALADALLAKRLPADPADTKGRLAALEKIYREQNSQAVKYPDGTDKPDAKLAYIEPLVRAALQPSADELQRLGQQRAQAVQAALLAKPEIAAERVFITTDTAPKLADDGSVRVTLKLE